jgi:hypothetical protein
VIAPHGEPATAARRDLVGCVINGAGKIIDGRIVACGPARDINSCAAFAKHSSDRAAGASAGACDKYDSILKGAHMKLSVFIIMHLMILGFVPFS